MSEAKDPGLKIDLDRLVIPPDRSKLLGNMLVRPAPQDEMSAGGIVIPDEAQDKQLLCDVLQVSEDAVWVKVGDQVFVGKYDLTGTEGCGIGKDCYVCAIKGAFAKYLPEKEIAE